jgi:hypothetical protein
LTIPSLQLASTHELELQCRLTQSEGAPHAAPVAQGEHAPPPQSTSDSAPFFTASVHVGAAQLPFTQDRLEQSRPTTHACVSPQAGHAPPQSTSVSVPFLTASLQSGLWHTFVAQICERQSAFTEQLPPVRHRSQPPPQSTSVSVPFLTPSLHVGA